MTASPWDEYSESVTFTEHYSQDGHWRGITVDRWLRKMLIAHEFWGILHGGNAFNCQVVGDILTIAVMNGRAVYRLIVDPMHSIRGRFAAELVSATGPVPDGWEEQA